MAMVAFVKDNLERPTPTRFLPAFQKLAGKVMAEFSGLTPPVAVDDLLRPCVDCLGKAMPAAWIEFASLVPVLVDSGKCKVEDASQGIFSDIKAVE
eukprot:6648265-Alexandrium_andersonii.AAC.1